MKNPFRYEHGNRSLPLDVLRGVAIMMVLCRHAVLPPEQAGVLTPIASAMVRTGWAGVDLFFVLSGYLVGGLLFAEYKKRDHIDVKRFVVRRGFKIWPAYFFYLAVIAVWLAWKHEAPTVYESVRPLWPNLLHVQNYFGTPRVHTWSLAVEEHFYLLIAVVFYLLFRDSTHASRWRWFPPVTIAMIVGLAAWRLVATLQGEPLNLYATHVRFDGLLLGTLVGYFKHFSPARLEPFAKRPVACLVVGGAMVAPELWWVPETNAWTASFGLTALYVGFALVMIGWLALSEVHPKLARWVNSLPFALLAHIGFYSYSIYLWHVDLARTPLYKMFEALRERGVPAELVWYGGFAFYVVVATLAGALLGKLVEMPALKLRDKLFPARAPGPLTPS